MKKLLFLACTVAAFSNLNSQTAAAARAQGLGASVSVRGVCTGGAELGQLRFVQDNTGGMAAYGNNLSGLTRGDSVVISGPIIAFNNLFEIKPATFVFVSSGAHLPNPTVITPSQFAEIHEGTLVKFINCKFTATGTFSSNVNYTVTSGGQSLVVRTSTSTPYLNNPIPTGSVNLVGIGSQFCATPASGCTDGYQLIVRDLNDITPYTAPTVTTGINEATKSTFVSVFPNPASSTLTFKMDDNSKTTSVKVSDISGRIVILSEENINTIDVSSLEKGLYNLSVSTEKGNYKSKFIVD